MQYKAIKKYNYFLVVVIASNFYIYYNKFYQRYLVEI